MVTIHNNSYRARHIVEVFAKEDTNCKGRWVAFYDSALKKLSYEYRRKNGHLYHGKYIFINGFGDTTIRGQYAYGLHVGTFEQYNDFNGRLHYITRYNNGNIIERKSYVFDENNKVLLHICVETDSLNKELSMMNNAHTRMYDTTGMRLVSESFPISNALARVKTYYPNGKVHEIFQISKGYPRDYENRLGNYEEYYPDGSRRTIGQYDFGSNPVGVWIYFDPKGKKTVKNYSNS